MLETEAAFANDAQKLPIWPQGVPNAKGNSASDNPDIIVHLPPAGNASGVAILICPGGGYEGLCSSYEGHDIAKWLNGYGIAGIVLKYRLSPYRYPVPLEDAQRAMRLIRLNAKDWNIDPNRIGVIGFSAGGHLASMLGTHFDAGDPKAIEPVDRLSCRPDFMILIYPVISMGIKAHRGSMENLLGSNNPTQYERASTSSELNVSVDTPMAFITHSVKDMMVSVDNSRLFCQALKAKGVSVEYLELQNGNHGLGCGKGDDWANWQSKCINWLKKHVAIPPEQTGQTRKL